MKTIKVPLAKCMNCGGVFIDTNPQVDASKFTAYKHETKPLNFIQDEMGYAHVCPVCNTDEYLRDLKIQETNYGKNPTL